MEFILLQSSDVVLHCQLQSYVFNIKHMHLGWYRHFFLSNRRHHLLTYIHYCGSDCNCPEQSVLPVPNHMRRRFGSLLQSTPLKKEIKYKLYVQMPAYNITTSLPSCQACQYISTLHLTKVYSGQYTCIQVSCKMIQICCQMDTDRI